MFENAVDPAPPFDPDHLESVRHAIKIRVWRRRVVALFPTAVVIGASYLLVTSTVITPFPSQAPPPEIAAAEPLTNDGSAELADPDGTANLSRDDVSPGSGGNTLTLDPAKITIIEIEPESDVTTIEPEPEPAPPAPDPADIADASLSTPSETDPQLGETPAEADVSAPSADGLIVEPTDDLSLQPAPDVASDQGADGVDVLLPAEGLDAADPVASAAEIAAVTEEVPVTAESEVGDDGTEETPATDGPIDSAAAEVEGDTTVETGDSEATVPDEPVDTTNADPVEVPEDSETSDNAVTENPETVDDSGVTPDPNTTQPADTATDDPVVVDGGEAGTPDDPAVDVGDGATAVPSTDSETDPATESEPTAVVVTPNIPITVEFTSMTINGSTVEIVLFVSDPDGWSIGACGTSMTWGDGSSTMSMCDAGCASEVPGEVAPGVAGEIRFTHTYTATSGSVLPTFTIRTGHECYGDSHFGVLNPALLLTDLGVVLGN